MRNQLLHALQTFSKLENNWDGYNAKPLTKQVLSDANEFLIQLSDELLPNHCTLSADNEIIFIWDNKEPTFILSLYGNGVVHCFADREQKLYFDDVPIENFNSSDLYKELQKYVENRNAGQCITK